MSLWLYRSSAFHITCKCSCPVHAAWSGEVPDSPDTCRGDFGSAGSDCKLCTSLCTALIVQQSSFEHQPANRGISHQAHAPSKITRDMLMSSISLCAMSGMV